MLEFSLDKIVENIHLWLWIVLSVITLYFLIKKKWKSSQTTKDKSWDDNVYPIDYEALSKAEEEVAKRDIRFEILQNHMKIKDFSNAYGYSEEFMVDLVSKLREHKISAEYLFTQSLPTGVASTLETGTGTWELYVERVRKDEALHLLRQWGIKI